MRLPFTCYQRKFVSALRKCYLYACLLTSGHVMTHVWCATPWPRILVCFEYSICNALFLNCSYLWSKHKETEVFSYFVTAFTFTSFTLSTKGECIIRLLYRVEVKLDENTKRPRPIQSNSNNTISELPVGKTSLKEDRVPNTRISKVTFDWRLIHGLISVVSMKISELFTAVTLSPTWWALQKHSPPTCVFFGWHCITFYQR